MVKFGEIAHKYISISIIHTCTMLYTEKGKDARGTGQKIRSFSGRDFKD